MSSHHIVRDEQEPALFLLEPEVVDFQVIESLLEWSPVVLLPDYHLDLVLMWGIKFEVLIFGNNDENQLRSDLMDYLPLKFIPTKGDYLQSGLDFLVQHNHQHLNLITNFDNTKNKLNNSLKLEVVIYQGESKHFQVKNGFWKKWLTKDTRLDFELNKFTATNLMQVDNFYLVKQDGWVEIKADAEPFWLSEQVG
jgi:thiamine pyrophosphokinase